MKSVARGRKIYFFHLDYDKKKALKVAVFKKSVPEKVTPVWFHFIAYMAQKIMTPKCTMLKECIMNSMQTCNSVT